MNSQQNKTKRNRGKRVLPKKTSPNYVCTIISDKEALRIHGISSWYEKNGSQSDSDTGNSSFDEEYFKNKPGPIRISRRRVVTVKSPNVKNGQLETGNDYSHTKTKKDISNNFATVKKEKEAFPVRTKTDPNQTLGNDKLFKKNLYEHDGANHQFPTNSLHTINTPIQQSSKGVSSGDKYNSKEIVAQTFNTNCLILKGLLNNVQGVHQTRAEKDCSISENIAKQNCHSVISSEATYPINIEDKVLPSDRKPPYSSSIGGDIERPGKSQITTRTRSDNDLIVVKQNVRNVPKISSQTASNINLNPKRSAMDTVHGIARQEYHSVISSGTDLSVNIQDKVIPSNTKPYSSSIRGDIERPSSCRIKVRTGLGKDVTAAKQDFYSIPKISSQTSSNTPKRSAGDRVRSLNYNTNTSDLPTAIERVPSRTSTRNAPTPVPSQSVQIISNQRDLLREQPSGNPGSVISENNSDTVVLFAESNRNCCGRFVNFLCCRKC